MSQEIIIIVDENDGDYLTAISDIGDDELAVIMPLIKAIKKFTPYQAKHKNSWDDKFSWSSHTSNYPTGEMCREDLGELSTREIYKFDEEVFELFEGFCPCPEHGFHDIISIEICLKVKKTRLL